MFKFNKNKAKLTLAVLAGLGITLAQVEPLLDRQPNAMEFPKVREQSDVDGILDDYQVYLRFILEVGSQTNRKQAQRLDAIFRELKRRDEGQAARFLRGIRFEMLQKLEMTGMPSERATTNNASIRSWVTRFLPVWTREADEYLFRARTNAIVRR